MKAVICGAGIAGLAMAERLTAHGWEVIVAEQAPGPRTQGYMIDFFGLGYQAAEKMGILPRMAELGYRIDAARYVDDRGRTRASLSYERFAESVGEQLLSIMRPDLELVLREQVTDAVDLRFSTTVTDIEDSKERVRVTLSDGSVLDADLLIGADGIHSTIRRKVFGDEGRFLRYLGLHTAAYLLEDPAIPALLDDGFTLTDSVDRMMGLYGLRDGRVAVFAVHRSAEQALPADTRSVLRREYASLGWIAPDALEHVPEPSEIYYDQVAQVEIPEWSRGRVVLIGDACQAVSLLAGQGASLAIAGAYVLAECLAKADSVGDGLARYQRIWQPVVDEKQRAGRRGIEWFLPSSSTRVYLRRIVLRLISLPGVHRLVSSTLVGKTRVSIEDISGESLHATIGR